VWLWAVFERRAAVKSVFSNGCRSVVDIATQLIRWTVDSVRADARASRTGLTAVSRGRRIAAVHIEL
jgi:hypothetical protein